MPRSRQTIRVPSNQCRERGVLASWPALPQRFGRDEPILEAERPVKLKRQDQPIAPGQRGEDDATHRSQGGDEHIETARDGQQAGAIGQQQHAAHNQAREQAGSGAADHLLGQISPRGAAENVPEIGHLR